MAKIILKEQATPVTPSSGDAALFIDTADSKLKVITDTGAVSVVGINKTVSGNTWTSGTSLVVTDTDATASSIILGWTVTAGTQVGIWTFTMDAGSFTINSTSEETGLTFNYLIYS